MLLIIYMDNFNSKKNKNLLFNLLTKSKIDIYNSLNKEIIQTSFNFVTTKFSNKNISLLDLNKIFIKTVIESKKQQNDNFLMSKDDRLKGNMENLQKRMDNHNKDFKSYSKKPPEEIDFKDKNWNNVDYGSIEDKINRTIEARKRDLEIEYNKKTKTEDFQNDRLWLSEKKKKNIKISNTNVNLEGTVQLSNGKRVRFEDDTDVVKRKISKLEKEVAEVKRQLREVLGENMMKKVI